jgi:hypothetical protein
MNTLGCLTFALAMAVQVYGTLQRPEVLRYNDKEYLLFSTPLESLFIERSNRPSFKTAFGLTIGNSSSNERGYVATWEIVAGKLYLDSIDAWLCWHERLHRLVSPCRRYEPEDFLIRIEKQHPRFASWYHGTLQSPLGKRLGYIHLGFGSIYEQEMLFEVKNGVADGPKFRDNRNTPLPEHWIAGPGYDHELVAQPIKFRVFEARLRGRETILPGAGLGKILSIGATRDSIESLLGKGDDLAPAFHLSETNMVEYRSPRIIASYGQSSRVLEAIYFHAARPRYPNDNVSTFKTDKGIDWTATVGDVRKAYGPPISSDSGRYDAMRSIEWKVLDYPGIEFRFENERLVRIGVLPIHYEK